MENFNEKEVRGCYQFLIHENETEIRLIDPRKEKKPESIFVHSENEFVEQCKKHNGKYNVYVGINERKPFGTNKQDVISIKTLIIDIDAIRPIGEIANEKELKLAERDCDNIVCEIKKVGCQSPVKICSGNGYQIWIAIPKIEITNENRNLLEEKTELFQTLIKQKFEKNGSFDQIGDLPRIIKVWGTLNIKGNNTKERPWRVAKVIGSIERKEDFLTQKRLLELKIEEYQSIEISEIKNLNEVFLPKPISYLLYEYKHDSPEGWMRIIETLASFFRASSCDTSKLV